MQTLNPKSFMLLFIICLFTLSQGVVSKLIMDNYTNTQIQQAKTNINQIGNYDLIFAVDNTGSMGGEISIVQQNILSIIDQIKQSPLANSIRYGIAAYRDYTDSWLMKWLDLTSDVTAVQRKVNEMVAQGGGDFEEAVAEAFFASIRGQWRKNAIKAIVWIADAPPHFENSALRWWTPEVANLKELGVQVHCINVRGDPSTETIMQQVALETRGFYVPLENSSDLVDVIVGAAIGDIDKQRVYFNINQYIINNKKTLMMYPNEEDRANFLLGQIQTDNNMKINTFQATGCPSYDSGYGGTTMLGVSTVMSMIDSLSPTDSLPPTGGVMPQPFLNQNPCEFAVQFQLPQMRDVKEAINYFRTQDQFPVAFPDVMNCFPMLPRYVQPVTGLVPISTNGQVPTSLPLSNIQVTTEIHDFIVNTQIQQTYTNTFDTTMQCQYVFPLFEGAVVTAFKAVIGDLTLVAQLFTNDQARAIYNQAVQNGDQAFLLDEESPSIFKMSVGNLPANSKVDLTLTVVSQMQFIEANSVLRYTLPNTIVPSHLLSQNDGTIAQTFNLTITAFTSSPILNVTSSLLSQLSVVTSDFTLGSSPTFKNQKAVITSKIGGLPLKDDFICDFQVKDIQALGEFGWVNTMSATAYDGTPQDIGVMLVMYPDESVMLQPDGSIQKNINSQNPQNVLLFIDTSLSMQNYMDTVKETAKQVVTDLPTNVILTVSAFNTDSTDLIHAQMASNDTKKSVSAQIDQLTAQGGSNIYQTLQRFQYSVQGGVPSPVFVITDGVLSNAIQLMQLLQENTNFKLHLICVGTQVDKTTVNQVAMVSGTVPEFIFPGLDAIEPIVARQVRRSQFRIFDVSTVWTNVKNSVNVAEPNIYGGPLYDGTIGSIPLMPPQTLVDPNPNLSVQYDFNNFAPKFMTYIIQGQRLVIYALLPSSNTDLSQITAKVQIRDFQSDPTAKPLKEYTYQLSQMKQLKDQIVVNQLACSQIINDLSLMDTIGNAENNQYLITEIALRCGVTSKYTSFVAVDEKMLSQIEAQIQLEAQQMKQSMMDTMPTYTMEYDNMSLSGSTGSAGTGTASASPASGASPLLKDSLGSFSATNSVTSSSSSLSSLLSAATPKAFSTFDGSVPSSSSSTTSSGTNTMAKESSSSTVGFNTLSASHSTIIKVVWNLLAVICLSNLLFWHF